MNSHKTKNFFRVSAEDFKKIPGSPVAYWISHNLFDMLKGSLLSTHFKSGGRFKTCDDELFLRMWWEVSIFRRKWHPFFKGGDGRKYYGNEDRVINWSAEAQNFYYHNGGIGNKEFFGKIGITWSKISSSTQSFRIKSDSLFNSASSPVIFSSNQDDVYFIITYLNSYPVRYLLNMFNPTASLQVSDVLRLPFSNEWISQELTSQGKKQVAISKSDWNSYETSWNFQTNPLLTVGNRLNSGGNQFDLSAIYIALRRDWQRQTEEMRRLEIENNRIFIDAYGLQDELSPEVPWNEITLTCNPWYRYGKNIENFDAVCNDFVLGKKDRIEILPVNNNESDERPADAFPFAKETEERLLEDTIKEYISYAVGCMMGRYSPEKPGLILANQPISGQDDEIEYQTAITGSNIFGALGATRYFTIKDDKRKITSYSDFYDVFGDEGNYHQFMDRDGVLPILDEEWFLDDIVAQFKAFLQFTFGAEHFADNLDFIEKALGKDIRKYFIKDFYKDHVQRYKKRPIYWMFSSPKGSFNALIYMHRYRPDTVSIVLNEYLREFISKIRSHREHLITENNRATLAPAEKTRNLKLIDKYAAMLTELDAYERDILYPLAQEKISIDLDDGVKVNYCKFGAALKKIPGLEAKEE